MIPNNKQEYLKLKVQGKYPFEGIHGKKNWIEFVSQNYEWLIDVGVIHQDSETGQLFLDREPVFLSVSLFYALNDTELYERICHEFSRVKLAEE